ncbi:MAG: 16S rRNA (adenine(1518)-N(6)/adenine(1519)-N(6))-dimethyltransferase RsmA [Candidatus Dojkabacteria bacterium]|jgi:16S rRNA (adenine1518-N6/adenine1519-N6)-dimethyltransferase|nr:16S rRNA (adenine(1518)-N(6)/adenine(1519)-N(6))-dimethyltransferase RsmA [Candidatus Dojkabacteria bacterium]
MKAKRSLGQNFFVNKNLADHIVKKVSENDSKCVVEIGPGLGFFTEKLIPLFEKVIVIEKDSILAENLRLRFPEIEVINTDFLDLKLEDICKGSFTYFGSLPYNVSKPIIRKIVESKNFLQPAYFIIQKEVAQKYIYQKPYNILSLSTAIYAKVEKLFDISPDSFRPKPNVNSSFVSITPNEEIMDNVKDLETLIQTSFRQPRKNLKNNLRGSKYENPDSKYQVMRPADLSLHDYIDILKSC